MFEIVVDTGGTFTDAVLLDEERKISMAKYPTNVENPSESIMGCIEALAQELSSDFCISAWISHSSTIVSMATGGLIFQVSATEIILRTNDETYRTNHDWNNNGWEHFAVQRNGSYIRFYQNGALVNEVSVNVHETYGGEITVGGSSLNLFDLKPES